MAAQVQFIHHEVDSIGKNVVAIEGVLTALIGSVNRGAVPETILPAIGSIRGFLSSMDDSLATIQRFLSSADGEGA